MDEPNELNEQEKALALIAIARQRNALLEEGLTRSRLENRQPDTFSAGFARPFQSLRNMAVSAIQGDPRLRENADRVLRGEQPLAPPPVEEPLPDTLAGRVGEVAGESLIMAVPFGGALSRLKPAADSINRIAPSLRNNAIAMQNILSGSGQTFRARPIRVLAGETALGGTSGAGGFYAEQMFPESDAARLVGEILGGVTPSVVASGTSALADPLYRNVLQPVGRGLDAATDVIPTARIAKTFVKQTWDEVVKTRNPATAGGRAADRFGRARGERSPEEVLAAMDEDLLPEARILMTPAQLSGVPGLLSLERSLADTTDTLKNKRIEDLERLNTIIRDAFRGPGDITQTQNAIDATRTHYLNLLNERLRLATIRTDESIQRMLPELGEEGANRIARRELESAYKDSTTQEGQLFRLVDQNAITPTVNIQSELNILRREAGETGAGSIPDYAINFFSKKSENFLGDSTSLQEMRNAQSELREIARNAYQGASPNRNLGRIANRLANAITDDLAMAQGSSSPESLANAINFSREKNNVFSEGTVGKILRIGGDSGDVVPEMLTLTQTMGQMGIRGANAVDEIINAASFARDSAGYAGQDNLAGALGSFMNNEFILAATKQGKVNVNRAQTFLTNNQVILDRFPEVRSAIESAIESGIARDSSESLRKTGITTVDSPEVSKAVLLMNKGANAAFDSILASRNSILETRKVIDMLGRDETGDALSGLKQGFFDYLISKGEVGNVISGNELANFVDSPKVRGVIDTLFDSQEKTRLYTIIRTAQRADSARTAAPSIEGITGDKISRSANTVLGILGAAYGRQISTSLGGGTIQIPGYTASLFRDLGASGMGNPAKRLIVSALGDEQLFRQIVMGQAADAGAETGLTPEASRRLNAWAAGALVRAGLGEEEEEQPAAATVGPQQEVPLPATVPPQARVQPTTSPTRGVPGIDMPAAAAGGPAPPTQLAAAEMYRQLFPFG